jgi:ABC-type nitrate/sulfonate/bicarbonate transport system ATPase subunit
MAKVVMENISKSFGTVQAVRDFNLTVEDKEFAILVAPSGCGKSTAPRMVAGLTYLKSFLTSRQRDPSSWSATGFLHVLQVCAPLKSGLPHEGQ